MNEQELKQMIAKLTAENEALKAKKNSSSGPSCKVTEKGGVSFYGVGRFPVTLYKEQWVKLLNHTDMIKAFIAANDDKLSVKATKTILKVVGQ